VLPRVLRALSGIFNPAMQGRLPAAGITAVSVVLAFGALAAQHYAAGVDEVTAQTDEHKLNLLYGDVFNDQGREDWNAGRCAARASMRTSCARSWQSPRP
jgi:hypothetical protein